MWRLCVPTHDDGAVMNGAPGGDSSGCKIQWSRSSKPTKASYSLDMPDPKYEDAGMRILCALLVALSCYCCAAAQSSNSSLADEIDMSRTIVAKLDRAAQNDPPPNFASSILVRVHKEASTFTQMADSTSELLRKGGSPDATTMFSLYSDFTDLYDQYDMFVNVTSTITATRKIELEAVMSTAMGKEFFEAKSYLEVATTAQLMMLDDALRACHSSKSN